MQYPWGYAVPVSHILSTCESDPQHPWGYALPVSYILSTCEDMQYPWVISSVPVSHILSTCEDMQCPWVNLYEWRMNETSLTGTEDMTHGYWGYDSRVLHIVYTGWELQTKNAVYLDKPSLWLKRMILREQENTQWAVLQKSCSTMGILLGKLIQFYVLLASLNTSAGRFSRKIFVKWALSPRSGEIFFTTWDNLWTLLKLWMFVMKRTSFTHVMQLTGKNISAIFFPGSEEHLFIYQGRQLCDDKQAPPVLINFKLIVRCF